VDFEHTAGAVNVSTFERLPLLGAEPGRGGEGGKRSVYAGKLDRDGVNLRRANARTPLGAG